MNDERRMWGIHTLDDNLFLDHNVIAIGWKRFGDLRKIEATRDAFKEHYAKIYTDDKPGAIPTSAGMLYRFIHEMKVGDYIIFPSKTNRMVNIGIVEGEYEYVESENEYVQQRKVKWLKHYPRTAFTQGALYEIGSAMSLFSVKNYSDEFLGALNDGIKKSTYTEKDYTVGATTDDIIENTKDYILKELSRQLKGYALEDFIANLLQAMGYRTKVSQQGGDSGIDIIAYKDELPPRILVQVKSQDGDIKETTIQSLKGAMNEGDYGLFIALSDYSKKAKQYLERTPIIRGINGPELVELVLKYYELLDEKYRDMILLKKVYIPVGDSVD